jgi:hypothetical protein
MSNKLGRPKEKYQKDIGDAICLAISQGHSLRKICESSELFPSPSAIYDWILRFPEFSEQYARAKMIQASLLAEEIIELSDDRSNDISGELGIPNGVAVQRSRLMVDTRKWYLSKVLPKVYGDKLVHEGNEDKPIEIVVKRVGG